MSKLVFVVVLAIIAVVAVGFYLDWFHVSTRDSKDKTNINVTVDKDKIKEDKDKAQQKVGEGLEKIKEKAGAEKNKG